MIINTGQRTDIPAFYSKWLMNRIKEGYVLVRNPYYPTRVTRYSLDPKVVDVIGFCTKNPKPMFPYLNDLKAYGQFWYVSITGFERDLEPNVPSIEESIQSFRYLSSQVGKQAVSWRYTPIIVNEKYTIQRHIDTFKHIAQALYGYTEVVTFGFLDVYDKLKKNHPELKDCDDETKIYITKELVKIAHQYKMEIRLCSKEKWLKEYGVDVEGCMRLEDYERAIGHRLSPKKKMQARGEYCACYLSNDIGAYNSCMHFCTYCYANGKPSYVQKNMQTHHVLSPFLLGEFNPTDQIKDAEQESWKDETISLFDLYK